MKRLISRECVVGLVFTAGCALPEFSARGFAQRLPDLKATLALPLVFFATLAWLNVRSITWWEGEATGKLRPSSAAVALAAAGTAMAVWTKASHPRSALVVLCGAVSALLLAALDRCPMNETVRRAAADLVLLTPLLCLPLAGMVR
jgi:hypothetical protein